MAGESIKTDVVVIGSGMAGLVSAVRATEFPVDVTLIEKGSRPGGKTYLSDGAIVVDKSSEPQIPIFEPLDDGLRWLKDLGVETYELERQWGEDRNIRGEEVDAPVFVDTMINVFESRGGKIYLNTALETICVNKAGGVSGVVAYNEQNNQIEIDSESVILCTGGFGGNEQLIERYVAEHADDVFLRADPWSTGDGFLAAAEIGGKTTDGLSKFDGHSMVAPPATFPPQEYIEATQYYGPRSIALDQNGNRFVDESLSELEVDLIQAVTKKADGHAIYVIDQTLYDTTWVGGHIGSMVDRAEEYGGNVIKADSLSNLQDCLSNWGVNGENAVDTIATFNQATSSDTEYTLNPPRNRFRNPIDDPPFYAVDIKPGLTFTMGGLDVNDKGQVIRRSNTGSSMYTCPPDTEHETNQYPIEGLYAVGIDAGNPSPAYYIGRLSQSLAGGRIAAEHAANQTIG